MKNVSILHGDEIGMLPELANYANYTVVGAKETGKKTPTAHS